MTETEEYTVGEDVVGGEWYENDLQLAAELGKTLLERNRSLEEQLKQSNHIQFEQAKEIELLAKQLEVLRNVNESRMRIYEEVDRNLQDLEHSNEEIRSEAKADKERMRSLSDQLESMEQKTQELQEQIERMRKEERQRKKREKRTWSVPSLIEVSDLGGMRAHEFCGFPSENELTEKRHAHMEEMRNLRDQLRNVKLSLNTEQRRRKELDSEMALLVQENKNLEEKVAAMEKEQLKLAALELELRETEIKSARFCKMCGDKLERSLRDEPPDLALEHDDLEEIPRGELVRLKNGGSAYGSRESLNTLGLEVEGETCPDLNLMSPLSPDKGFPTSASCKSLSEEGNSVSLLGELETQYRSLVKKYEMLIEAKSKRNSAKDIGIQENLDDGARERPKELSMGGETVVMRKKPGRSVTQNRGSGIDLTSPKDPTEGHFENGPPEYKKLFKEIFETLRRSVVYEDDMVVPGLEQKKKP